MIEIKPSIKNKSNCPYCQTNLTANKILWQGMHVCIESECTSCNTKIIEDLKVGHAVLSPYKIDMNRCLVHGNEEAKEWLGNRFMASLNNPQYEDIHITKEVFKKSEKVIILNCIDYIYGHSLLKLLNAQRHLQENSDYGLVVIIQKFLRWMLPDGISEVWTVDIPLKKGQSYYVSINKFIQREIERFSEVSVSEAYSHPSKFDITNFTKVNKHDFQTDEFRVTFIWREDRIWLNYFTGQIFKRLKLSNLGLLVQNWRIQRLFKFMSLQVPQAKFTVIGLGTQTKFPEWIEDLRVDKFDKEREKFSCLIYSESRIVIGIQGSNMLLPSGHAGMTICLIPTRYRWGNIAQDIIYQENDSRLVSFRYRFLPIEVNIDEIAYIATNMLSRIFHFQLAMTADK